MAKTKIINDPVHGFIRIKGEKVFNILEHPYLQRLRRIKQLGLTNVVYPGALHTRFHHVIGSYHLMCLALDCLREKGVEITDNEYDSACLAILLHDIGHGPFSHALESTLIQGVHHEELSIAYMHALNEEFKGELTEAIQIFEGNHPKIFLHQLISGQLDLDRLDYIKRDSFYSGVFEGNIGTERIIMMLNVYENRLVIEEKAILSIEKFLQSRRFMYWQVYLHKTVLGAEMMLINLLKRVKTLYKQGFPLFLTPTLQELFEMEISGNSTKSNPKFLNTFADIDDADFSVCFKSWAKSNDFVLRYLSRCLVQRKLFKTIFSEEPFSEKFMGNLFKTCQETFFCSEEEVSQLLVYSSVSNTAYSTLNGSIEVLYKNGKLLKIEDIKDFSDSVPINHTVTKYFVCFPKELEIILE